MSYKTCTIKQLADHVKTMKEEGISTALLIGAGVSVTAGIALAGEMVEELILKFPRLDLNKYKSQPNSFGFPQQLFLYQFTGLS